MKEIKECLLGIVDDFVILHESKEQLEKWKKEVNDFLTDKLRLELHPDKSRIIPFSRGIDFVGFRIFYYYKILRKRNTKNILCKIKKYLKRLIDEGVLEEY